MVPPAPLRGMWPRRLLRQLAEPARQPARHRSTGHSIVRSFEPGEDWFWDYETQQYYDGPELAPPEHHPLDQPTPGPAGRVPSRLAAPPPLSEVRHPHPYPAGRGK